MSNLDSLKQILQEQKTAVESKGGTVVVKNLNVSPSEITEGINSIPLNSGTDVSDATATAADVLEGKTFYAGDDGIKTGTLKATYTDEDVVNLFMVTGSNSHTTDKMMYVHFPDDMTVIKNYLFYLNRNPITVYIHQNISEIREYAFYNADSAVFPDFVDSKVTRVSTHAFNSTSIDCLDHLPETIKIIGSSAFANTGIHNTGIKINAGVGVGESSFSCVDKRATLNFLDISEYTGATLPSALVQNINFKCDFKPPKTVTTIGTMFNYNGSFENIYIPQTIKTLNTYCFDLNEETNPAESFLKSIIFEAAYPPASIKTQPFPVTKTDYKIFVPDGSEDNYKTNSVLKQYANLIYPMSQRDN